MPILLSTGILEQLLGQVSTKSQLDQLIKHKESVKRGINNPFLRFLYPIISPYIAAQYIKKVQGSYPKKAEPEMQLVETAVLSEVRTHLYLQWLKSFIFLFYAL